MLRGIHAKFTFCPLLYGTTDKANDALTRNTFIKLDFSSYFHNMYSTILICCLALSAPLSRARPFDVNEAESDIESGISYSELSTQSINVSGNDDDDTTVEINGNTIYPVASTMASSSSFQTSTIRSDSSSMTLFPTKSVALAYPDFVLTTPLPARSSWMQDNANKLIAKPLKSLCLPGSHDSGDIRADTAN